MSVCFLGFHWGLVCGVWFVFLFNSFVSGFSSVSLVLFHFLVWFVGLVCGFVFWVCFMGFGL